MKSFILRLATHLLGAKIRKSPTVCRVRPEVEGLEDRQVLSVTFFSDMTQLAQQFPTHAGATMLYLNFDGNTSQGVSSFQAVSGDRNRDIHDVLFRTQEMFAPFNVTVSRIYGNASMGTTGGASTIFIGDYASFGTGAANSFGGIALWAQLDYPGTVRGVTHVPNSNAFDFAFVDPISGAGNASQSIAWIAQTVAHEAGHNFGLVHVTTATTEPDAMSYDTTNARFMNRTFNITDRNYDASTDTLSNDARMVPMYFHVDFLPGFVIFPHTDRIVTQNSYTYLNQVLGARPVGSDLANVANAGSVDGAYWDGYKINAYVGATVTSNLTRGDFDVFRFSSSTTRYVTIDAKQAAGSYVDPVLFVYDSTGTNLLAFNDDSGGTLGSQLIFRAQAGQSYQIVVGGYGGNSTGNYVFSINATPRYLSPLNIYQIATVSPWDPVIQPNYVVNPVVLNPYVYISQGVGVRPATYSAPTSLARSGAATSVLPTAPSVSWDAMVSSVFARGL